MQEKLNDDLKITGKAIFTLTDIRDGKTEIYKYDNLVVTTGKVAIARRLANIGLKANEGMITYGATGTGAVTPTVGDLNLQAEIQRKLLSSTTYSNNIAILRVFFNEAESIGALAEFGLFGEDASGTVNSGTLFNRIAITITKTALQTLTIQCEITIS